MTCLSINNYEYQMVVRDTVLFTRWCVMFNTRNHVPILYPCTLDDENDDKYDIQSDI